ncbi:MAG: hypothetical protein IPO52_07180 [Gemmatimonadetes bacterium]|nr:hypothetical protein [Gemmatimonadota bacterium]
MLTTPAESERAAQLLAAQLDDLARYRHVVQAQRAVLRMGDAGLLEIFSSEADGIVADISAREVQLLAVRAAVQAAPPHVTAGHPVAELHARVERERALASAAARDLAAQMGREAVSIAHEIAEVSGQIDRANGAYRGAGDSAAPVMIDRTG